MWSKLLRFKRLQTILFVRSNFERHPRSFTKVAQVIMIEALSGHPFGLLALIFVFLFGFESASWVCPAGEFTSYIIYAMTAMVSMNTLAENIIESIQALGALRRLAGLVTFNSLKVPTLLWGQAHGEPKWVFKDQSTKASLRRMDRAFPQG